MLGVVFAVMALFNLSLRWWMAPVISTFFVINVWVGVDFYDRGTQWAPFHWAISPEHWAVGPDHWAYIPSDWAVIPRVYVIEYVWAASSGLIGWWAAFGFARSVPLCRRDIGLGKEGP